VVCRSWAGAALAASSRIRAALNAREEDGFTNFRMSKLLDFSRLEAIMQI